MEYLYTGVSLSDGISLHRGKFIWWNVSTLESSSDGMFSFCHTGVNSSDEMTILHRTGMNLYNGMTSQKFIC
jgi:hypothetical protein